LDNLTQFYEGPVAFYLVAISIFGSRNSTTTPMPTVDRDAIGINGQIN